MNIATDIEKLEFVLNEVLMAEWEAQGHSMTGKVVKEIEYKVKQEANKIILSGFTYPYGNIIAAGVKPGKVPFRGTAKRGQGTGGTSLYIQGLKNFVKQRMHIQDEKKCLSIAFAIAKTQKNEGMPTYGSYRFSNTGKRMDWIEEAFRKNEGKIIEAISTMALGVLSVSLDVILNHWQLELNQK